MIFVWFFLGLCIGSFLNVVILRLQTKETLFFDHSRCPSCKEELGIRDLIPLVSFLFLAGRCRYCRQPISWQYPAVEFATGLLFAITGLLFSDPFVLTFWLFFIVSFIVIITYDIKFQLIPDAILWPFMVGVGVYVMMSQYVSSWASLPEDILASLITGGFILFLVLITKERAMGWGDVPLAFSQGLLLGYAGIIALGLSFILGASISMALLLSGRVSLTTTVPFTPFLIAGILIVLFRDVLSFLPFLDVSFLYWLG